MKIYFDNKNDLCHFEHVERKGAGHPDTLCDAIAEKASVLYAKYCLENFGRIAHHWFDKTMLIGGESDIKPGYGELIKPYNLIFAGKVTYAVGEHKIPVDSILFNAAEDILCHCLTGFDAEKHMRIENRLVDYQGAGRKESRYRPVSKSILPEINEYTKFTSNDCNLISGYAPFSILETMVIQVEKYINSTDFKQRNPFTGWDVKVFGTREHDDYSLIINLPILAKFCISDLSYENYTRIAKIDIIKYLDEEFNLSSLHIEVNPQDRRGKPYITVLGSAADTGDVGVVGRGNRLNGLITPMRPMSIEAPAGKNPIDHTGKIYGLFSRQLALQLYEKYQRFFEVHIYTSKESYLIDPDKIIVMSNTFESNEISDIERFIKDKVFSINEVIIDLVKGNYELW